MTIDPTIEAYLEEPHFGVLATINRDGTSQQTLMWYALVGHEIVMNTAAGRRKHRNIDARPEVSLCVVDGRRYVTIQGRARVEADDPGLHRQIGERYVTPAEMDRLFAETYNHQDRRTIRMTVDTIIDGRDV